MLRKIKNRYLVPAVFSPSVLPAEIRGPPSDVKEPNHTPASSLHLRLVTLTALMTPERENGYLGPIWTLSLRGGTRPQTGGWGPLLCKIDFIQENVIVQMFVFTFDSILRILLEPCVVQD